MKKYKLFIFTFFICLLIPLIITILFSNNSIVNILNTSISIDDIDLNKVPYISTYYITPKVPVNENVVINFYVTDYYHKEYTENNNSEEFTITVKIDRKKDIVLNNIKAGDNSINIGSFKKTGEQKFSILATDKYGRNSHELFNYFLVTEINTKTKEYIMTNNDLIKYRRKLDGR